MDALLLVLLRNHTKLLQIVKSCLVPLPDRDILDPLKVSQALDRRLVPPGPRRRKVQEVPRGILERLGVDVELFRDIPKLVFILLCPFGRAMVGDDLAGRVGDRRPVCRRLYLDAKVAAVSSTPLKSTGRLTRRSGATSQTT